MSRAAIVVVALVLGVAAVPVAGAANEISNDMTCRDLSAAGAAAVPGDNCFAGSTLRRAVVAGLLHISAGFAVLAMLFGMLAAVRGSRGVILGLLAIAAILVFFGAYGAARV